MSDFFISVVRFFKKSNYLLLMCTTLGINIYAFIGIIYGQMISNILLMHGLNVLLAAL